MLLAMAADAPFEKGLRALTRSPPWPPRSSAKAVSAREPARRRLAEQGQVRCSSEASRTISSNTRKTSSLDDPESHSSATPLRRACSSSVRGSTGTPIRAVYPEGDSPTGCVKVPRCERGSSSVTTSAASPNTSTTM